MLREVAGGISFEAVNCCYAHLIKSVNSIEGKLDRRSVIAFWDEDFPDVAEAYVGARFAPQLFDGYERVCE